VRIAKEICGNCAYWNLTSGVSVVGFGGKYYSGELKGLCMHGNCSEKTLENSPCNKDEYLFIGDKEKAQYIHKDMGLCHDCKYWQGDITGWLGNSGESLGLCDRLERGTDSNTYCTGWEHDKR